METYSYDRISHTQYTYSKKHRKGKRNFLKPHFNCQNCNSFRGFVPGNMLFDYILK